MASLFQGGRRKASFERKSGANAKPAGTTSCIWGVPGNPSLQVQYFGSCAGTSGECVNCTAMMWLIHCVLIRRACASSWAVIVYNVHWFWNGPWCQHTIRKGMFWQWLPTIPCASDVKYFLTPKTAFTKTGVGDGTAELMQFLTENACPSLQFRCLLFLCTLRHYRGHRRLWGSYCRRGQWCRIFTCTPSLLWKAFLSGNDCTTWRALFGELLHIEKSPWLYIEFFLV